MRLGEHLRHIDARLAAFERNGGTDGVLRFQHARPRNPAMLATAVLFETRVSEPVLAGWSCAPPHQGGTTRARAPRAIPK